MAKKKKVEIEGPTHVSHRSILDDLDFSPEHRASLDIKIKFFNSILDYVKKHGLTPRQLEKVLDVSQPRVSELLRGKIGRMQIETLVKYASRLGLKTEVSLREAA